jgi:hypothetical protein
MLFNDLLGQARIDPRQTAVMLHGPPDRAERYALAALVDEAPDLFDAYQDNHPPGPEATLKGRTVAASFVLDEQGEGRFAGLWAVAGWTVRTAADLDDEPRRRALTERLRGASYSALFAGRGWAGRAVFDLRPMPELADLRGRLVVGRPAGRAYMRRAETSALSVIEIGRTARFVPPAPDWGDFVVTVLEVRALPAAWAARLREWRGIYLITDQTDGARYVGSAAGAENLLGRWSAHAAGDAGVTVELKGRDPGRFRFAILELLSPTAPLDMVSAAEAAWKRRLDTRTWGLNRN